MIPSNMENSMTKVAYEKFTDLWSYKFGPLPDNYDIKHVDGDHKNNNLTNLSINGLSLFDDNAQAKLRRMANHFGDEGLYVKENYCYEIIEYIDHLEAKLKEV